MARSYSRLRGAAARHATRPRVRADAPHAVGPGGGQHAAAMQGRHRVGREHAVGDGGCRLVCREVVQGTRSSGAGWTRAGGRGDAWCESLRTFVPFDSYA